MIRRLGVLVLAVFGMAGCGQIDSIDLGDGVGLPVLDRYADQDTLPDAMQDGAVRVERPASLEGESEEDVVVVEDAVEPPTPRRKPSVAGDTEVPVFDPELLVGLDFEATKTLLGSPAVQIEQPPAKVWAYAGGGCTFSVFFYPSVDDQEFRVLTYEVTGTEVDLGQPLGAQARSRPITIRDRESALLRRCFAELLHKRDQPDAG